MYYNRITEKLYNTTEECIEDLKKVDCVTVNKAVSSCSPFLSWDMFTEEAKAQLISEYYQKRMFDTTRIIDCENFEDVKFIHIHLDTDYCGTGEDIFDYVPETMTDEVIEADFRGMVYEHYWTYAYIIDDDEYESIEEKEEAEQQFEEGCFENSYWEYISLKEYLKNT